MWFYQWPDTGIGTSKKQGCHSPFITASCWHVNEWRKNNKPAIIIHYSAI
jgi:hypothetical protein